LAKGYSSHRICSGDLRCSGISDRDKPYSVPANHLIMGRDRAEKTVCVWSKGLLDKKPLS
jgi:hypothetical protein